MREHLCGGRAGRWRRPTCCLLSFPSETECRIFAKSKGAFGKLDWGRGAVKRETIKFKAQLEIGHLL